MSEAEYWHQLGIVYQKAEQWEQAETAYREAARIQEERGNLQRAANSWDHLAQVCTFTRNSLAAEDWFRKALEGRRASDDRVGEARTLHNLAKLLSTLPRRLAEARRLAEEGLTILQTLEPGVAEIWETYTLLAEIAGQQNIPVLVRRYRRQARQAKAAWSGAQYELQEHLPLIERVVHAVADPQRHAELEPELEIWRQNGWSKLVAAIRRLLAGERDEDALCEGLSLEASMIILAILHGIADPESLRGLG